MNQDNQANTDKDKMEAEYDFTGGVRGKYFARYHGVRVHLAEGSPFVASPPTDSSGYPANELTLQIVVTTHPVYQGPSVVDNLASEVN